MHSKKFQTGKVLSISFTHFVHDVYSSFLAPISPLLKEKFGLSYTLISLLQIFQRIPNILNPFVGIIADRKPVRFFVILTPIITAVSMSLLGVAPNYAVLAILLFAAGLSAVFFHVPTPVIVKEISGKQIGKGMSFYMIGGELARTIGPLFVGAAIAIWGLEGTIKLIPFAVFASIFIYFKLNHIDTQRKSKKEDDIKISDTLKKVAPIFLLMAGLILFRQVMKSGLTSFLPMYFDDIKQQDAWAGYLSLAVYEGAGILGTFYGGKISDKLGRKFVLLLSGIISPMLLIVFLNSSGIFVFFILILVGLFQFASSPVLLAYVQEIDSAHPSFVNSLYMLLSFSFSALTVLFFGVISDWKDLHFALMFSAFLAFGAIPFILLLPQKKS